MRRTRIATGAALAVGAIALTLGNAGAQGDDPAKAKPRVCFEKAVTILGTSGPDALQGTMGKDVMRALRGDDVVDGDPSSFQGGGKDRVCGGRENDAVSGGPGDDLIDGGAGNDTIDESSDKTGTERLGADQVLGGAGDDIITEQGDGAIDTVDCGLGNDRAVVDVNDEVSNCETVIRVPVRG